jgi:hypothetical protein
MNLGNWLRSLGLERYEAAFRDNAIDEAVLHDLKEDHLRELGLPLGARIKLLKAIAALPQEAEIQFPAGIAVAGSPANSAERRQVTVMFSDLVGSTALSVRPRSPGALLPATQPTGTAAVIDAADTERSITATKALVARWVGIVSAAWRVICSCSSSTDGSSTNTYRHSAAYGRTTINATTINATTIDATVINAGATDASASSICEGVS